MAKGRAHISPEEVPWDALRSMLKMTIYGNRIDNTFDQRMLEDLVSGIVTVTPYSGVPLFLISLWYCFC